jgi:hypothetical protein
VDLTWTVHPLREPGIVPSDLHSFVRFSQPDVNVASNVKERRSAVLRMWILLPRVYDPPEMFPKSLVRRSDRQWIGSPPPPRKHLSVHRRQLIRWNLST